MIKTHKGFQKKAADSIAMLWSGTAINPEHKKPMSEWKHFTAFMGFYSESEIDGKDLDIAMEWIGYNMLQGFPKYDCHVDISMNDRNWLYVTITSDSDRFKYDRIFRPSPPSRTQHMTSTTLASS